MEVDHFLQPQHVGWEHKVRALVLFGGFVKQGLCGHGQQIIISTVRGAFTAIGAQIAMACEGKNPITVDGGEITTYPPSETCWWDLRPGDDKHAPSVN